jgi:outer membrane protein assembly factor BamE (lipoprotein component of BamABCDE complex)
MKILSLVAIGVICVLVFFIGGFPLSEGYNPVKPTADTKFASNYAEETFNKVTVGMDTSEVFKLIGEPLGKLPRYASFKPLWYYSVNKESKSGDFAWLKRAIIFGRDGKVREVQKSVVYE